MSIIRDGFRSLYRSGAWFTENCAPDMLKKAAVPKGASAKTGHVLGGLLGIGSLIVGAGFCLALPLSFPMFTTAVAVYGTHGLAIAAAAAATLAGTAMVVLTAGLGMCCAAKKDLSAALNKARGHIHFKHAAPSAPEKTSFKAAATPAKDFRQAVDGAASQPTPAALAPVVCAPHSG